MPQPPIIETERLVLRPFTLHDIPASYQMNLDAEVSRYTGDGGVVSREEIERRIKEDVLGDYQKYGYGRLAVSVKGGPDFIGFAGLKYLPDLDEVDLGYRLMSAHWGNGYGTEAARACMDYGFNTLGLTSIVALVLPENAASVHVLEKLGFAMDGEVVEDGLRALKYVRLAE